eukprot:jgi/Chlat1/6021/Chrsp4S06203
MLCSSGSGIKESVDSSWGKYRACKPGPGLLDGMEQSGIGGVAQRREIAHHDVEEKAEEEVTATGRGKGVESIKTMCREGFANTTKLVNGFSALVVSALPHRLSRGGSFYADLRAVFAAPSQLPTWLQGSSNFNSFLGSDNEDAASSGSEDYTPSGSEDEGDEVASPLRRRNGGVGDTSTPSGDSPLNGNGPTVDADGETPPTPPPPAPPVHGWLYRLISLWLSIFMPFIFRKPLPPRSREDLHMAMELAIEKTFDVMRSVVHSFLSPLQTLRAILRRLRRGRRGASSQPHHSTSFSSSHHHNHHYSRSNSFHAQRSRRRSGGYLRDEYLRVDVKTVADLIREAGYPYEAMSVVTEDGYIILLERLPRRNSKKVVYLQHGLLDSSLGWCSTGMVGTQAFVAYDQGYDVFLGNFRGMAVKEHVDRKISARRYWNFSINEHSLQDIPALVRKIHQVKCAELCAGEDSQQQQPYTMAAVAHSLGGAAIMLYVVACRRANLPHRLSRVVLLSPAGFHHDLPVFYRGVRMFLPLLHPLLSRLSPGIYIPTRVMRLLFSKLTQDLQNLPGLRALVQVALSAVLFGSDSSDWVGAIAQPHYNMYNMPGVSYNVMLHLCQIMDARTFRMFDYGSRRANLYVYGTPEPLDVAAHYGLVDVPVDVVAGKRDGLIPASMVRLHHERLARAGRPSTFNEFDYAHLDFTFGVKEELLSYLMSRLALLPAPAPAPARTPSVITEVSESQQEQQLQSQPDRIRPMDTTPSRQEVADWDAHPQTLVSSEFPDRPAAQLPRTRRRRASRSGTSQQQQQQQQQS